MLHPVFAKRSESPAAVPARRPRRAATAMEYLVVASFILVVLIAGVQHLASATAELAQHDADATNFEHDLSGAAGH